MATLATKALTATLALGIGIIWALPSQAQMRTSRPSVGGYSVSTPMVSESRLPPMNFIAVPRGDVIPEGRAITSASLQYNPGAATLGTPAAGTGLGFGYSGNALSLSSQSSLGPSAQLNTGITGYATTPWAGRIDVAGKFGLLQERAGGLFDLAGQAGAALNVDANGTPSLGFAVGVPISKTFGLMGDSRLALGIFPNWGTGLMAPGAIGSELVPSTRFALGVGGYLNLANNIGLIADTSLATDGAIEASNVGVDFGLSPSVTLRLSAGLPGTIGGATSYGAGLHWSY
ncbi:hypothetical protein D3C86_1227900 [compost metagenome]